MTTLTFRFSTNADEITRRLDEHARRQLPFAISRGINRTTKEIADQAKAKLPSQFRFRSDRTRRFFEQFIGIDPDWYATRQKLRGTVGVRAPLLGRFANSRQVQMLTKFQTGGVLTRPDGQPHAIPTDYLRSLYPGALPRSIYPRALGVLESRSIEGGQRIRGARTRELGEGRWKTVLRGKRRTFAIDPRFHQARNPDVYGVWQRRGRGRESEPFLLWAYKQRIRVPKRLTFLEDATAHAQKALAANVQQFLAQFAQEARARAAARRRR